ncbi:hypothetical protein [Leifsonia sp. 2MCAF36]|uniref:hypothetical protein n=1 Tax=Leifsonia sp. 2MCAF36 TaxID=3232988 RepID=UPI003F9DB236
MNTPGQATLLGMGKCLLSFARKTAHCCGSAREPHPVAEKGNRPGGWKTAAEIRQLADERYEFVQWHRDWLSLIADPLEQSGRETLNDLSDDETRRRCSRRGGKRAPTSED